MALRDRVRDVVDGRRFQRFVIAVIVVNAVTLGCETSTTLVGSYGELFDVLAPRYAERPGGYIRVLTAGFRLGKQVQPAATRPGRYASRRPAATGHAAASYPECLAERCRRYSGSEAGRCATSRSADIGY